MAVFTYMFTWCNIPEYLVYVAELACCPQNEETSASKVFESTSLRLHRVTAIKICHVSLLAPRTHCNKILPHSCIFHVCPVVSGTVELSFILQQWNTSGASIWVGVVELLL